MNIIIALIILGIILMLVEMLLIPGVGIAGFGSLAALAASCWYAFEKISTNTGIWVTAINLVIIVAMLIIILRNKTWKRFELKEEITARTNTEIDSITVGSKGVTATRLAPMGTARFDGITCEVKSFDNSMVDPATEIEVCAIENGTINVKTL